MIEKKGKLYLCGTPVGNLEDITFRAIKILKEVDFIAAEDTRHTKKLLNYYEINKPLLSYYEYNKDINGKEIIKKINEGKNIALVSDAGTPGISDPGYEIVNLAIKEGIEVDPIPGASALLCAFIASGLPTDRFAFEGFLPRKKKERVEHLEEIKREKRTIILYESPHRIRALLEDIKEIFGNRKIVIGRELTKIHQEFIRETLDIVIERINKITPRGEYTIVLEGAKKEDTKSSWDDLNIEEHILFYLKSGLTKKDAIKRTAVDRKISKKVVYKKAIELFSSPED